MYYFLDDNIAQLASGLEHAEFKRIKLFNRYQVPAKIATTQYSTTTRSSNAHWQLAEENFVNLFDFYAGTEHFNAQKLTLAELPIARQKYRIERHSSSARFWDGERQVAEVHYFSDETSPISTVDYFDGDAQKIRTDVYDERGFMAYTKFYATKDNVEEAYLSLEQFVTLSGRPYLEITYRKRGNGVTATNYRLLTNDGETYSFMNTDQLNSKFYDDLNLRDGEHSTFISDRSMVANRPMTMMQTAARKIEWVHSIHFSPYREPLNSELVYPALNTTDQLSKLNMVIAATPQQADNIRLRLRTQVPIMNIPVGMVSDERLQAEKRPMTTDFRERGKIIIVARLFPEKNLSAAIRAFKLAHDQLDWLTLDIYGYNDGGPEEQNLRALVQELQLQACVQFKGYTNNLEEAYQHAELMLLTSRFEAFVLAILEANSYGVPAISYDTYYGPAYLINNDQNGYVVPYGDRDAMVQKIVDVMSNPDKLQQLSTGAYERAADFSEENVWKLWQAAVIDTDPANENLE
ncbi:glycosyltransferase [Lactiplantibacillus daoliensis]|uniref:Glycosyltransferase n=1 Tax=Lactiplantibacillus daoliensis TaxID=2559916 RepID=A0ABW1UES1_9LACO|nr:glycosyltransferase [Lactiplantibacillus daoliensis]